VPSRPASSRRADSLTPLSELADLLLNVGRLVRARTPGEIDAVPLNDTERTVMRIIDLFPGASPSEIAGRARLQRSNVSTALRTLEAKGMITRTSSSGRGVTVTPTPLAATNLKRLHDAWARELAAPLASDLPEVRQCVALLAKLELSLIGARATSEQLGTDA
jgi:DNA-binding MarR family transcriptional regulator